MHSDQTFAALSALYAVENAKTIRRATSSYPDLLTDDLLVAAIGQISQAETTPAKAHWAERIAWLRKLIDTLYPPANIELFALPTLGTNFGEVRLNNMGIQCYRSQDYQPALQLFAQAIHQAPAYAEPYSNRGQVFFALGIYREAQLDYLTAIALDARFAAAHSNLGQVYAKLERYDLAVTSFDQALAISPTFADARFNRGVCALKQGDLKAAQHDFEQTIAVDRHYFKAYANLGVVLSRLGQPHAAIANYRRALEHQPSLGSIWFNLGVELIQTKQIAEARSALAHAAQLGMEEAHVQLARLQ
jgi:tetratricopeptide (TPR) repeat protein